MPALAAADLVAGKAFRRWGTVVRSARRFGSAVPTATLIGFVLGLAVAIVVGLPLIAFAALVGGARFAASVRGFVYGRISFMHLTAVSAASAPGTAR